MSTNSTKTIKGRIINKHGTEEYWILSVYTDLEKSALRDNPFIPLDGELVIYDPDSVYTNRRIKIGDGVTNVVDLPFIGGGDNKAIIDVVELPTENINENVFYRLLTSSFWIGGSTLPWTCHIVEELPSEGELLTSDFENFTFYYLTADGSVSGYADEELAAVTGFSAGWYDIAFIMEMLGGTWGGIVYTKDTVSSDENTVTLLLNSKLYDFKGSWKGVGGDESEGSGKVIIDIISFPIEDIVTDTFYRLLTGEFYVDKAPFPWTCTIVEDLPEVGVPITSDMSAIESWVFYYSVTTGSVSGYIDDTLSNATGLSTGWHNIATVMEMLGGTWGGIFYNESNLPSDSGTASLLLKYSLYYYKEEWNEVGGDGGEKVGRFGTGTGAEIFNVYALNIASGNYSHAEGFNTTAKGEASHVEGRSSYAEGEYSHAEGEETHAGGYGAHAEGTGVSATGQYSHAEGNNTIAEGDQSHAEGNRSHAEGDASHSEGDNTTAKGNASHSEGWGSHAEGYCTHAEGYETTAKGDASHAEGWGSHAEGNNSHAEGHNSHAEGNYSHAEGDQSHAEGTYSHAEGTHTHAEGAGSHAEGFNTHAHGNASHAEGGGWAYVKRITGEADATTYAIDSVDNLVVGAAIRNVILNNNVPTYITAKIMALDVDNSTITVSRTLSVETALDNHGVDIYVSGLALGQCSHVEGYRNIAAGSSQHVQGEFNVIDPEYNIKNPTDRGKYAHIVGNGTDHTARSNAHTLDWGGTAWYAGEVKVGGTGQDDKNAKKLATEEYVDSKIGSGGDGKAIIDVVELPTENINEQAFYRLLTGALVFDQYIQNSYTVYCVESLPEVGEPATNSDNSQGNLYYNVQDGSLNGYIDANLSAMMGAPEGWYLAEVLLQTLDYSYSGVITNILDDPIDGTFRLLLEYVIYSYKEGKWTSQKTIGWAGTGTAAEIFNHPSNIASGIASHAEGNNSHAEGYSSHAEGAYSHAAGDYSHAEGAGTAAHGDASHAEGSNTTARGHFSHAEGQMTYANAECSHTEGYGTMANGGRAHAEGLFTRADGNDAHAEGCNTIASGEHQHAQGIYNIEDTENKYAHIVGNGTGYDNRSNAHTIDWEGNAWFAGNVYVGGTGQDDPEAKILATEEYVDTKIAEGGGDGGLPPCPTEDGNYILNISNGAATWVAISRAEEAKF